MRLQQDAVDLLEVDGADAVANGLEERADAQVAGAAQVALGGADDEPERLRRNVACGNATASSSHSPRPGAPVFVYTPYIEASDLGRSGAIPPPSPLGANAYSAWGKPTSDFPRSHGSGAYDAWE